jgi:hypothetical protein
MIVSFRIISARAAGRLKISEPGLALMVVLAGRSLPRQGFPRTVKGDLVNPIAWPSVGSKLLRQPILSLAGPTEGQSLDGTFVEI